MVQTFSEKKQASYQKVYRLLEFAEDEWLCGVFLGGSKMG